MSAIISDQFRILNAKTFVNSIESEINTIYSFIGQPYATNPDVGIGRTDWSSGTNQGPIPLDTVEQENRIKEAIIALKKITSADIRLAIRKNIWKSGQIYEMYRHDYSIYNLSPQTSSSSLYEANYYVINENYRVYICLNNGTNTENPLGRQSLDQPDFIDLEPRPAGTSVDGYIWKYLFTITPSDILKFDTSNYIALPKSWGLTGTESSSIKNNAINGKIESVIVKYRGAGYPPSKSFSGIPILGDGRGGKVTIVTNSFGEVSEVFVTDGGYEYTKGIIKFEPGAPGVPLDLFANLGFLAQFDIIIPPKGGHGYDVYNELGAYRVLIYSRFETDLSNPDVIVGNDFATIGIINNPIVESSSNYVSALKGLKLIGGDSNYIPDEIITQTVGTGITAIGYVASWNNDSKILRYYQSVGSANSSVGYILNNFSSTIDVGGSLTIVNSSGVSLGIDTIFDGSVVPAINNGRAYILGSNYTSGISSSEYKAGSGDIIYIDNRQPILRSLNQKEDIKIILEF